MSSLELEDNAVFPDCDSDGYITAAPEQEKRAKFYIEDEHDMVSFRSIRFGFREEIMYLKLEVYVFIFKPRKIFRNDQAPSAKKVKLPRKRAHYDNANDNTTYMG